MNADDESSLKTRIDKPDNITVSIEKTDVKKPEKGENEDPKPRIVLTFRSEKSSTKSTNMKIVSTNPVEEKHEEVSPRRSNRTRGKWDWVCDSDPSGSPKKDKSQPVSENDESDSSHAASKRTRRRSKDETATPKKERSINDAAPGPTQRLSRRIKPTAKVLANEELRIGVESMNNARLGVNSDKSPEEGVRTRRSARPAHADKKVEKIQEEEVVEIDDDSQNSDMKLKHLCTLGLKAISVDSDDNIENKEIEPELLEDDEEIDDDSEVISKLLEADEDSDEDFLCSVGTSSSNRPRRSTRLCSSYGMNDSDRSSPVPDEIPDKTRGRRTSRRAAPHTVHDSDRSHRSRRKRKSSGTEEPQLEAEQEYDSNPAGGEEGSEAACPVEESTVVASCLCEAASNVYADSEDLTDPVFCQAIEVVDGVRVGCSHAASVARSLRRAGPRAPYLLPCTLHAAMLDNHMCCPACGLFCTQGTFYQCSKGHLFHCECGLPYNDSKQRAGCPHCGVHSYRWQPVNTSCTKVRLEMKCSNKRIFLPDQREQCTPAYLGFTTTPAQVEETPIIPEDLLPPPDVIKKISLCKQTVKCTPQELYDAILKGESIEELMMKIGSTNVKSSVSSQEGGSCLHAAARCGHVGAAYLLHAAGADPSATDDHMRTPLMIAVLALVEKLNKKEKSEPNKDVQDMEVEVDKTEETDNKNEVGSEEDIIKVMRFLVAAGCDVNIADDRDGLSPLHVCAQHGLVQAAAVLLRAATLHVDVLDHGAWTPLVWAAEHEHTQLVRMLLSAGASSSTTDKEGNSAVSWCAAAGASSALPLLLASDPSAVQHCNSNRDTPLHIAARQGHYACVVILLAHGARTDIENSAGELPVDVCTGPCQSAISLNMQMTMAVKDNSTSYKLLSSDISNGREMYPIPCVNQVDEEPAPADFTYVTAHVMPEHIDIDYTIQTMQGCSCAEGSCSDGSCECVVLGVRAWWRDGRLLQAFPHHDPPMMFHCNLTCKCNHKRCQNNTITRLCSGGSVFVRSRVERLCGARGWGLASVGAVPRGSPVAVYVGELLPLQQADTRADDSYMFALDVKPDLLEQCSDRTLLCVDAREYGGAARFMNHSCRANLAPVRVFTGTRDLRLPAVALFATTDIQPGEHFTFDYGDKFWSVKSKFMRCECGAPDCRYPVKTDETDS